MTYSELDRQARAVAGALQARKAQGERVVLMFPPGPAYVVVFLGCLYAGAVAVPVYPPSTASSKTWPRLRAILLDSRAALALTTSEILPLARSLLGEVPELSGLRLEVLEESAGASLDVWEEVPLSNETLALLQYTSGSTGNPKGVAITHGNLLHNSELIRRSFDHTRDDRGVIWLPPYHDMGLIGGILQPLYVGFPVYLMSASSFIRRPARWLETISAVRGTISGGPDFAYELCARSLTPEQCQRLDLSSWRVAFTGAEPVRARSGSAERASPPAIGTVRRKPPPRFRRVLRATRAARPSFAPVISAFCAMERCSSPGD